MRILAIRGENLASFAEPFEVRLDTPPLSSVGLFAITGPTGAGKSTLLDAICLALFDQAPRLDGQASVAVGHADHHPDLFTKSTDRQSLVRRGAGHGFAEVDYVGRDGRRYRARWEARRARRSPTGRFQDVEMRLVDLEDERPLGGARKTETLAAIERTLGLTYAQFRRSTLLAQNDFAAFLREKGPERAALLEQMTGTEIYSRISIAAFERAKVVREELAVMEREITAIGLLSTEDRDALERKRDELVRSEKDVERRSNLLRRFVEQAAERARLERGVHEAAAEVEAAARAWEELAPRRVELARAQLALHLGPRKVAFEEAAAHLAQSERDVRAARESVNDLRERLLSKEAAWTAAEAERVRTIQVAEAAGPDLEEARRLDAHLEAVRIEREECRTRLVAVSTQIEAERSDGRALEERLEKVTRILAETDVRLASLADVRELARSWERVEADLGGYVEASAQVTRGRAKVQELEAACDALREAMDDAAARVETETRRATELETAWREAAAAASALEPTEEERRTNAADRRLRERALRLEDLWPRREGIAAKVERETAQIARFVESRREAEERTLRLAEELERTRGERDGARDALSRLHEALTLAERREALREGEACPLCGSTEHPYRISRVEESFARSQAARVEELEGRLLELVRSRTREIERAEASTQAAREAEARRQELEEERARVAAECETELAALSLGAATDLRAVEELRTAIDQRLQAWAEREARASSAHAEAQSMYAAAAKKADEAREIAEQRSAFERSFQQRRDELLAEKKLIEDTERERSRIERLLGSFFPDATSVARSLRDDGPIFVEELRARVFALREAEERRDAYERERQGDEALRRERMAVLSTLEAHQRQLRVELERRESEVRASEAKRAALLGGRPTAEVEDELGRAIRAADEALERARKERDELRVELARGRTTVESLERSLSDANERAGRLHAELDRALSEHGMTPLELEAWLVRGEAFLHAARNELERAERAKNDAEVVLEERRIRLASHLSEPLPADLEELDEERARQELDAAVALHLELHREIALKSNALARDDEARATRTKRTEAFERARRESERWTILDDLLGSADGKKFRRFAQSLTLEALLRAANRHLDDLAPRYRLMRVPGQDMELQVLDRDMADEIRSVASLSGGETFLVSLALALGLSSLSSRNVHIDSLFIDEGFGSLDPETLEIAVAALESLQATGRQVGVISHVASLAEKIGTEIRVERQGGGRSRLRVVGWEPRPSPDPTGTRPAKSRKRRSTSTSTVD